MENLLDLVKGQITETIIHKAAAYLGEDANATAKAFDMALPAVLSGIVNEAATSSGAENLVNTLKNSEKQGDIMGSLGFLLGGGSATQGLLDTGGSIVTRLFGSHMSGISNFLAQFSGIKSSSASGLMSIAAPIFINIISHKLGNNQTAGDLTHLLGQQLPYLQNAHLPTGLKETMGLKNITLNTPSVPKAVESISANNGVVAWVLLLAAAAIALYSYKACNVKMPEVPTATPVIEKIIPVSDTVKTVKLPEMGK